MSKKPTSNRPAAPHSRARTATRSAGAAGLFAKPDAKPKPVAKKATPRSQGSRPVEAGDTLAHVTDATVAEDRAARRTSTTTTVQESVVSDLLVADASTGASMHETAQRLQTLLAGASPDEVKALRKRLFAKAPQADQGPDPDAELSPRWRSGAYPYKNLLSRKVYEKQKYRLQVELLKLQAWVKETGARVVVIFEGRDAAGKGGAIKRFMEHLNPRGARVVALEKPSETERGQWYFQRYIQHLPTRGEIVMFDRSWYNRSGVERVMGFCSEKEYEEFLRQTPEFERQLVRSGVHLFKFWFSVSQDEQRRRFKERKLHPLKQWKLSPIDMASLDKWGDYTRAKEAMFLHCDTSDAPWTVIKSDCKKRARLNAMRYVLHRMPYATRDLVTVGAVDPLIVGRPSLVSSAGDDQFASSS
ncbi:MAG: polyphosphate kinase 2 [Deltaproteobacteria bacterium]|nr:polyphosphate kinase 2 [Deltaproteobacteria bacterium]MBK8690771.1 polyphosphate kinase 2 [Deltaproteobacteria bacterium]MBP6829747.1 polyphosphate kinase 2 [Deltaproteobacteria bacterium]